MKVLLQLFSVLFLGIFGFSQKTTLKNDSKLSFQDEMR